jgi:hypothetical protein
VRDSSCWFLSVAGSPLVGEIRRRKRRVVTVHAAET